MTPKQRFLAALRLEAPDRIPLMYQHLGGADHLQAAAGLTLRRGFSDHEAYAKLSMASYKVFGFDNVMAGWGDLLVEASAFGARLSFRSDGQYPREEPLAMDRVDEVLEVDPLAHPQWSVPLKAAKLMNERIGGEVLVLGCSSSPFIVAGSVIGFENLLVAQMTDPGAAHGLLGKIAASEALFMRELAEFAGVEAVFLSDAVADAEQNTLAMCQEFDIAYTKVVLDAARAAGLLTIVHNCSEAPYAKEEVQGYLPDAMHLAARWPGIREMARELEGKRALVAGIDHRKLIYMGPMERIVAETIRVASELKEMPGLILAPACELAFDTPLRNVLAFRDAARSIT